ncbi:MAG: hypothetical protein UW09_C0001G0101 [candidate division TM6 bacterium GW2011_GWF2_43_87]|nr:MAG: hypothetical protein UW09_C0001G0101 [candidate division TM6 bacterium GW2011_GWF2_43_87]
MVQKTAAGFTIGGRDEGTGFVIKPRSTVLQFFKPFVSHDFYGPKKGKGLMRLLSALRRQQQYHRP